MNTVSLASSSMLSRLSISVYTGRILDKKVDKAPETKIGHSTVKAQVDFVSKGYLLLTGDSAEKALTPDQVTMTVADWVIGFAIALGATFLPTTAFYIAFFSPSTAKSVSTSSLRRAVQAARGVPETVTSRPSFHAR